MQFIISDNFVRIILITLIVGFIVSRILNLTASCLWFDEIFSVHATEMPWGEMLTFVSLDIIHPPLFYTLLKIWIGIVGDHLLWLRTFPVIFSVLAICPFILLQRELKLGRWTTVLSLFLITVNGSVLKYSQEVRMYSMLMCISLFSIWLFARFFERGKSFWLLTVVNVLMVYTHYFGWFVVFGQVLAALFLRREKLREMFLMLGITAACFAPWAILIINAAEGGTGLGQNIGWMTSPDLRAAGLFILNLIEPFYFQASSNEPVSIWRVSLPVLLITTIAIGFLLIRLRERAEQERQSLQLLSIFVLFPLVSVFLLSWVLPYSIWGTRHLIIVFAPMAILLSAVIVSIPLGWLRTSIITMLIGFGGYAFFLQYSRVTPTYSWCLWEPLTADVDEGTPIYAAEDLVAYHVWFANRKSKARVIMISKLGALEDVAYFLPRGFREVSVLDARDFSGDKLWLAFRGRGFDLSESPLRLFTVNGYRVAEQKTLPAAGENAYLVLLEK